MKYSWSFTFETPSKYTRYEDTSEAEALSASCSPETVVEQSDSPQLVTAGNWESREQRPWRADANSEEDWTASGNGAVKNFRGHLTQEQKGASEK